MPPNPYFSFRTPLNGVLSVVLTSMNRPLLVSRFTQLPAGVWVWLRSRTAPTRCSSPLGGFLATAHLLYLKLQNADAYTLSHHSDDVNTLV